MPAHQPEPVLRLCAGIFLRVALTKGVAHLVESHRGWHVQCLVTGCLQPQRKVEVLGPEGIEGPIESAEPLKQVCPYHHGATACHASGPAVALAEVELAVSDR